MQEFINRTRLVKTKAVNIFFLCTVEEQKVGVLAYHLEGLRFFQVCMETFRGATKGGV